MIPKKSVSFLLILAAASCGRTTMKRDQQRYEVVQEGSASGVTSTIDAPGETTQPLTTGTNIDTTTAFTLPGTATTTSTAQPGTVAGTLPDSSGSFPSGYIPRPRPRPPVQQQPTPPGTSTASPPATQTAPTTTDAVAPTTTSTTTTPDTTVTSSPGDQKKRDDQPEKKDKETLPPPRSDTTGTPGHL